MYQGRSLLVDMEDGYTGRKRVDDGSSKKKKGDGVQNTCIKEMTIRPRISSSLTILG